MLSQCASQVCFSRMHGSHFHRNEYEISSNCLGPSIDSTESFKFPRSKKKGEGSPAAKNIGFWKLFSTACFTVTLLTVGLIRSIGPANTIKAIAVSQVFIAYLSPKLLIAKRSVNPNNNEDSHNIITPQKIMELLPKPLHLIITFDDSEKFKKSFENVSIADVINPLAKHSLDNNTLTLFESIAFSWCDSYVKNKRYPTKLTIVASSQVKPCVLGQYRWSMKFPKSLIDFQKTNSSSVQLTCPETRKDPFDCSSKNREEIRLKYSQLCPDMAPVLLACNNRITLERALSFKPPWASQ